MTLNLTDQECHDLIQYMNKAASNPAFLKQELEDYANEDLCDSRSFDSHALSSDDVY